MGRAFRIALQAEIASRNELSERDAISQRGRRRKLRPGFDVQNGMHFPVEVSAETASQNSAQNGMRFPDGMLGGNYDPVFGYRTGYVFRDGPRAVV